jgi:hypothetical protein
MHNSLRMLSLALLVLPATPAFAEPTRSKWTNIPCAISAGAAAVSFVTAVIGGAYLERSFTDPCVESDNPPETCSQAKSDAKTGFTLAGVGIAGLVGSGISLAALDCMDPVATDSAGH